MMKKVITVNKAGNFVSKLKQENKKIVLAGGCFDILHAGHIAFLEKSKKVGDVLILLLESDEAIKKLKGENRPINKQSIRAKILSAVEFVDFIILLPEKFETNDYRKLVKSISPDIIAVTAGDPNIKEKKSQAKEVGGKVKVVLKKLPDYSTTKLIDFL